MVIRTGASRTRAGPSQALASDFWLGGQDTRHQPRRDRGYPRIVSQCYDSAQGLVNLQIKVSRRLGFLPLLLAPLLSTPSDPYLKEPPDTFLPHYDR